MACCLIGAASKPKGYRSLLQHTTWQVSRQNKGFGRALRAQNLYFFMVNLRTLPSHVQHALEKSGSFSQGMSGD
jgi:hypothetical protein